MFNAKHMQIYGWNETEIKWLTHLHTIFLDFDLDFDHAAFVTTTKMKAGSQHYAVCLVSRAGSVWKWRINWWACSASLQPFEGIMIFLFFRLLRDGYIISLFLNEDVPLFCLRGQHWSLLWVCLSDVPLFISQKKKKVIAQSIQKSLFIQMFCFFFLKGE